MSRRTWPAVTVAALAIAALPATGAGAVAAGPCRAVAQSTGSEVVVVLEGHYSDKDGGDVRLTCHLVQGGSKVVSVTDPLTGPVAATVSDQRLGTAPFRVCYSLAIEPLNPWAPYHYASDC
jgi:DNA-binding beta-propeller fold protein YncE